MNSLLYRFLVTIPIIILSVNLRCQTVDSISELLDKIQMEKTDLLLRVDSLNLLIDYLAVQRNVALQKESTEGFFCTTTLDKDVYKTPSPSGGILFTIQAGTRLCVMEQEDRMYKIYSDGKNGYIYPHFLEFDNESAKEILQTNWKKRKNEMEEMERKRQQAAVDEIRTRVEIEQKKKKEEDLTRRRQEEEQRKQNIFSKYSEETAKKIIDEKIWIGMTKQMAIDSWGHPGTINRTVTETTVKEQWVYRRNYNTIYLYFRNGILYTYQD